MLPGTAQPDDRSLVVAVSLMSVGCKKAGGGDDMVKKMTEMRDAMCKCAEGDSACANKVLETQKKSGEEMAKSGGDKDATPDPDLQKKLDPINAEMTKCAAKAMTPKAGATGAAPAAGSDAAATDKKPDDKKPDDKAGGW